MPRLNDPRVANATAPLPAEAPDPAAFRYQPDFDALQTEIGKLEKQRLVQQDYIIEHKLVGHEKEIVKADLAAGGPRQADNGRLAK